jgi:prepilin-type N-terminal cleavage/methylation domain-containing protein
MRRALRGYTVVEVMMALAVLSLGAGGVIAMEKATLIANTNARNLVTANGVAQAWMERMRVDALSWNEPAGVPDLTTDTEWLKNATGTQALGMGWFSPALSATGALQPAGAPQADVMGADIFTGDPSLSAFCPQVRLTQLSSAPCQVGTPTPTPPLCSYHRLIRVEVRVFWDKSGRALTCSAALPSDYNLGRYGFVYLVSAVLENNSPI